MRHVISALVMNEPGVLANVANLFSARGFNIDSLVVGRTENPELSRMTVVVDADDNTLEQVRKQLAKLVPVVKVKDFKDTAYIERDFCLITVNVDSQHRNEVVQIAQLFRAKVVDVALDVITVEATGNREKLDALIKVLEPFGLKELVQSGMVAIGRGGRSITDRALRPVERSA